ncbi:hypothetical protein F4809DRAFT_258917 [Biscogniauxia mediterranea]|nr:hypothetical protein F4809DRAFT_258917 [Biscogniauxia mediterranea]
MNTTSPPSSSLPIPFFSTWPSYPYPYPYPHNYYYLLLASALAAVYLALCRALRFRAERRVRARLGYADADGCGREALARMTGAEAQQVLHFLAHYEFPLFSEVSLQFGLFKTYGIESISKLLVATRNLIDPIKSRKRYEDTAALIGEFVSNPPTSERHLRALARMNYLHSGHRSAGRISDADLLYTLSVFVLEPARWARLYDWRPLSDVERCAYGVFWKEVGDAMGIPYAAVMGPRRGGPWRDGLAFADDLAAWAKDYEVAAMRPSAVCHKPAVTLIPMITYWLPWFAQPFATEVVCALLGDRVREAFMLPEPGPLAYAFLYSALCARKFALRHLALPRLSYLRRLTDPDPRTGRMRERYPYGNYPFYVEPTPWNRWGPGAWAARLCGGKVPGDDPDEFMPGGYTFEDLGPRDRAGMGVDEMEADVKRMAASGHGGCPFGL